jgi:hypothetical protein
MNTSRLLAALLLCSLLAGCTVIDVRRTQGGVRSDAFIAFNATAGWPADASVFAVGLFEGRSPGTLLMVEVWKLLRFELGFLGMGLGVGPLDVGLGVLFYKPRPPRYVRWSDDTCGYCSGDDCGDTCYDACESSGGWCLCGDVDEWHADHWDED